VVACFFSLNSPSQGGINDENKGQQLHDTPGFCHPSHHGHPGDFLHDEGKLHRHLPIVEQDNRLHIRL